MSPSLACCLALFYPSVLKFRMDRVHAELDPERPVLKLKNVSFDLLACRSEPSKSLCAETTPRSYTNCSCTTQPGLYRNLKSIQS